MKINDFDVTVDVSKLYLKARIFWNSKRLSSCFCCFSLYVLGDESRG